MGRRVFSNIGLMSVTALFMSLSPDPVCGGLSLGPRTPLTLVTNSAVAFDRKRKQTQVTRQTRRCNKILLMDIFCFARLPQYISGNSVGVGKLSNSHNNLASGCCSAAPRANSQGSQGVAVVCAVQSTLDTPGGQL